MIALQFHSKQAKKHLLMQRPMFCWVLHRWTTSQDTMAAITRWISSKVSYPCHSQQYRSKWRTRIQQWLVSERRSWLSRRSTSLRAACRSTPLSSIHRLSANIFQRIQSRQLLQSILFSRVQIWIQAQSSLSTSSMVILSLSLEAMQCFT